MTDWKNIGYFETRADAQIALFNYIQNPYNIDNRKTMECRKPWWIYANSTCIYLHRNACWGIMESKDGRCSFSRQILWSNKVKNGCRYQNRTVPIAEKIAPFFEHWLSKNTEYVFTNRQGGQFKDRNFRDSYWHPPFTDIPSSSCGLLEC